jgi:hypothetical protein
MPAVIDSFSSTYEYYRLPIKKGFGTSGESLEDFLHYFRQNYDAQDVAFADPGLGWQSNQYNGVVCIGIFYVYTLTPDGNKISRVGIINTNAHHMEHAALKWLNAHRQRNPDDSGLWPTLKLAPPFDDIEVCPVQIPEEGMI